MAPIYACVSLKYIHITIYIYLYTDTRRFFRTTPGRSLALTTAMSVALNLDRSPSCFGGVISYTQIIHATHTHTHITRAHVQMSAQHTHQPFIFNGAQVICVVVASGGNGIIFACDKFDNRLMCFEAKDTLMATINDVDGMGAKHILKP